MTKTAQDLAQSALALLRLPTIAEIGSDPAMIERLELAAAIMATHVLDWHLAPRDLQASDRQNFASRYPDWEQLRLIANGTKHASIRHVDVSQGTVRRPEWEDDDFWYAEHGRETSFVEIDDKERSVRALVYQFCADYLRDHP